MQKYRLKKQTNSLLMCLPGTPCVIKFFPAITSLALASPRAILLQPKQCDRFVPAQAQAQAPAPALAQVQGKIQTQKRCPTLQNSRHTTPPASSVPLFFAKLLWISSDHRIRSNAWFLQV